MNLRDLHYLTTLAECGQFARAAKLCHVSQPSLSIQIKKLEDELGVQLFERPGRSLIVTQAGKAIIEKAKTVLQSVEEMRMIANQHANAKLEFRLGIIPTIAPYILPYLLADLRQQLPDLQLRLIEAQTANLELMLADGSCDAIITSLPLASKDFECEIVHHEKCFVAVPANHPLATKSKLNSRLLANEHMLLLDEGHCFRNHALALCAKTNMSEDVDFRATSLETLRQMVASGEGITLIPLSAVRKDKKIIYIPCPEKGFTRVVGLSWRRKTPLLQIVGKLKLIIADFYKNLEELNVSINN